MNKHIELPLTEPVYSTYHFQGPGAAIAVNNPTSRNWFLNNIMNLQCSRKFLTGFTTPEISIASSGWYDVPQIEKHWINSRFVDGYINPIIRKMLDNGYYITFGNVDDYYIKGKSWYHERHFAHDGLICGYDQNNKTYCIYAYDSNWIYRKFWTSQKAFNAGRTAMLKHGVYSQFCGVKMTDEKIEFSAETAVEKIKEYLDSNLEKYPFDKEGMVYGIVVQAYIAEYVMRLYREEIPYERMDRRVFRMIWEHKKVMLERIEKIQDTLCLDAKASDKYKTIVAEADNMRMLYAAHHMKRRDSVLPIISKKLLNLMENEREILTELTEEAEREMKKDAMEIS